MPASAIVPEPAEVFQIFGRQSAFRPGQTVWRKHPTHLYTRSEGFPYGAWALTTFHQRLTVRRATRHHTCCDCHASIAPRETFARDNWTTLCSHCVTAVQPVSEVTA